MKDSSFWIGIGGLAVAALTIVLNFAIEIFKQRKELERKKYEVEFLERRKSFAELCGALRSLLLLAARRRTDAEEIKTSWQQFWEASDEAATAFYEVIPFLPTSDHAWLDDQSKRFEQAIATIWSDLNPETQYALIKKTEASLSVLRKELFDRLFD